MVVLDGGASVVSSTVIGVSEQCRPNGRDWFAYFRPFPQPVNGPTSPMPHRVGFAQTSRPWADPPLAAPPRPGTYP